MSLYVLDTDILTLYYRGDPVVVQRVHAQSPAELAISVLTVDEQLTGWYTLARQARRPEEVARAYAHLGDAVVRLGRWRILPYTESAIRGSRNPSHYGSMSGSWICGSPPWRSRNAVVVSRNTGLRTNPRPCPRGLVDLRVARLLMVKQMKGSSPEDFFSLFLPTHGNFRPPCCIISIGGIVPLGSLTIRFRKLWITPCHS